MNTLQKLSMSTAVIGGLLLSTQASYAAPLPIQNPGFEADTGTSINTITSWTAVENGGNGGVFTPSSNNYPGAGHPSSSFTSAFGQNVAYSNVAPENKHLMLLSIQQVLTDSR